MKHGNPFERDDGGFPWLAGVWIAAVWIGGVLIVAAPFIFILIILKWIFS